MARLLLGAIPLTKFSSPCCYWTQWKVRKGRGGWVGRHSWCVSLRGAVRHCGEAFLFSNFPTDGLSQSEICSFACKHYGWLKSHVKKHMWCGCPPEQRIKQPWTCFLPYTHPNKLSKTQGCRRRARRRLAAVGKKNTLTCLCLGHSSFVVFD